MSELIKEIESILDKNNVSVEELYILEDKLSKEYNIITEGYRTLFHRIKNVTCEKRQEMIMKCQHHYTIYTEYHNERYFVCNKCGHEK
tara:strand:- start:118 stop:381 length:264 start_codon:yes stop_codon:yes gene_type:complete